MKISLPGGHLLPPFSVGYVKGWKRCVVLLIVLQSIRELNLQDEIAHEIKVTLRSGICCCFPLAHLTVWSPLEFLSNAPGDIWNHLLFLRQDQRRARKS